MKFALFIIFGICLHFCYFPVTATTSFVNSGAKLIISSSKFVIVKGNIQNSNNCIITNNGTIKLTGNWLSSSSSSLDMSSASGSVFFCGSSLQTVGGSTSADPSSVFKNFTLNNASGVALSKNIGIKGTLQITAGDFDLRDYTVDMGSAGSVSGDNSSNRIKATDGATDGRGAGFIFTTQNLGVGTYNNIAGLGLNLITATNFGSTVIKRGHLRQQGTGSYSANFSIYRYYEILPTGKTSNYGTVTINYFPASELNGHTDGQLVMFQLVNMGGPTYWTPLATTNTSPQAVATTVSNNMSSIKVTCGSNSIPLPIELLDFTASCQQSSAVRHPSSVLLQWSTATETNNAYFTIERSSDGINFVSVATIPGSGNANDIQNYLHTDYLESVTLNEVEVYYRLGNTDFNGATTFSDIVSVHCAGNDVELISIYPNPAKNELFNIICSSESTEATVSVVDILGRKLIVQKLTINKGNNNISMDVSMLSPAVYEFRVETNNGLKKNCKQLIIGR